MKNESKGAIHSLKLFLFPERKSEDGCQNTSESDNHQGIDSLFNTEIKSSGEVGSHFRQFLEDTLYDVYTPKSAPIETSIETSIETPIETPTNSTYNASNVGQRLFKFWEVEDRRNASSAPYFYTSRNVSRDRKSVDRLSQKNPRCVLSLEIEHLIDILKGLNRASYDVPQSCLSELAKGIAMISSKFELSNLSEDSGLQKFDGFTAALITMDHIGFSRENHSLRSANDKMVEELNGISAIHNVNRKKAQFSSFAYDELYKILHEKTEQVIRFIKTSPLYDIQYEDLNLKSTKYLMVKFPSVRELALASYDDLNDTYGVGQSTIISLHKAFEELNLPTVFVTHGNLAIKKFYESEISDSFYRINEFNVPYSICGKRNSTYVSSPYLYYLNFERKDRCDENGTKLAECSEIKGW